MTAVRKKAGMIFGALLLSIAMLLSIMPVIGEAVFADDGAGELFVPIEVRGFNVDAIYEEGGDATAGIDSDNDRNAFCSIPGLIVSSFPEGGLIKPDISQNQFFKLGDYAKDNVLKLTSADPNSLDSSGTLTFSEAKPYTKLLFLATGGNGGGTITATVKFADNNDGNPENDSTSRTVDVPDWVTGGAELTPICTCKRYNITKESFEQDPGMLFKAELPIPDDFQNRPIEAIDFTCTSLLDPNKSTVCLFAVSGVENTDEDTHTIMFDSDGGVCGTTSLTGPVNGTFEFPDVQKTGHVFKGWLETPDGEEAHPAGSTGTVQSNRIYTAQWKENEYIELDMGYNYSGLNPIRKWHKTNDGTWPDPVRKGYKFTGFTKDGNVVNKSDLVPGQEYKATWKLDPSTMKKVELYVQGVQVTRENCSDVLNDSENKGKVSYDFKTNTLTLNNANLKARKIEDMDYYSAILYDQDGLGDFVIRLVGDNTITKESNSASEDYYYLHINNKTNTVIDGSGTLAIDMGQENEIGIQSDKGADILISGVSVEITSSTANSYACGIMCGNLECENAKLRITPAKDSEATLAHGLVVGRLNLADDSRVEIETTELGIIIRDSKTADIAVAAGSVLEVKGSDRAIYEGTINENTQKLGVKIKENQDTEYKLWKGTPASLSDNSIKAVYFPGYDVKHVKAKEPSCMAEGNTEHWTITDDSGETTYYNNETPADVNKVSKAQVTIAIDSDAHEWGEPEYTWSSDKKTVTAKRVCKNNSVHIEEETANVISEITREATATENGERTYVAAFSNPAFKAQTRKEAIPKKEGVKDDPTPAPEPTPAPDPSDDVNKKGVDGTALGRGASAAAADKAITTMKSDKDPAGSRFAPLKLKSVKQGKNSVKLTWKKVSGAKTYVVYGNVCGKKNKMKKLTTVKKNTLTVKKIKKTLRKGTYHKFIVVALDKNRMVVSTSKVIHAATKGSKKKANPKGVTVKAKVDKNGKKLKKWTRTKAVAVKKGKTTTLKASITKARNTTVRKHVGPRFESSNKKIVKVTAKGKVKGIKKGTAKIYVFAQNGVCRTISVTVR